MYDVKSNNTCHKHFFQLDSFETDFEDEKIEDDKESISEKKEEDESSKTNEPGWEDPEIEAEGNESRERGMQEMSEKDIFNIKYIFLYVHNGTGIIDYKSSTVTNY